MADPKGTVSNELQQREQLSKQSWNSKYVISLRGPGQGLDIGTEDARITAVVVRSRHGGQQRQKRHGGAFLFDGAVCLECGGDNFIANTRQNSEQQDGRNWFRVHCASNEMTEDGIPQRQRTLLLVNRFYFLSGLHFLDRSAKVQRRKAEFGRGWWQKTLSKDSQLGS